MRLSFSKLFLGAPLLLGVLTTPHVFRPGSSRQSNVSKRATRHPALSPPPAYRFASTGRHQPRLLAG